MRDHLIITINGVRHEIRGGRAFQSLSDFLRYDLRITGTKVVCAEGDCGSCTTFLGRPGDDDKIQYSIVTSCIQYLYQLDASHIVTVEGLRIDKQLNAVQESMVANHGAQCGFCTPGFVVAMCDVMERKAKPTEQDFRCGLVGNLCRCTGYQSIVQAGMAIDPADVRKLEQLYSSESLKELRERSRESVMIRHENRTFFKPTTIAEAVKFRGENPTSVIISGGTDLGVQINKGIRDPTVVMNTTAISEMRGIRTDGNTIVVGATASLTDLENVSAKAIPELNKILRYFGSPQIRNAGTLAGNIANGSPIGDSMPALFVLNAEIELAGTNGSRRININSFYTGYRKTVMTSDELITRVFIPVPNENDILKCYKISKRKDLDISSFAAAIWMRRSGKTIDDVRIAYNGVGPVIMRLPRTEAFLKGKSCTRETMLAAGEIVVSEVTPISDVRGSAEYRNLLAKNILLKFHNDTNGHANGNGGSNGNGDGNPWEQSDKTSRTTQPAGM